MTDRDRRLLALRYVDVEAELAAIAAGRVVHVDPATGECTPCMGTCRLLTSVEEDGAVIVQPACCSACVGTGKCLIDGPTVAPSAQPRA